MSTATVANIATQTKVVQVRNVSKVFKRDAFEVKALDDVSLEKDPLQALAEAFLHRSAQTSSKYDEKKEKKGQHLLRQVKTRGAEGVIFAAASFCDPALLERPMLLEILGKHKIPYTAFKYAENTGQMAPIREQTGTFADSIKLWSAA